MTTRRNKQSEEAEGGEEEGSEPASAPHQLCDLGPINAPSQSCLLSCLRHPPAPSAVSEASVRWAPRLAQRRRETSPPKWAERPEGVR